MGSVRKFALFRELHGKVWVNSKGREEVGVLVGAETAKVGVREDRATVGRRRGRIWRSHRRLACH
jgi:hypothetical protein